MSESYWAPGRQHRLVPFADRMSHPSRLLASNQPWGAIGQVGEIQSEAYPQFATYRILKKCAGGSCLEVAWKFHGSLTVERRRHRSQKCRSPDVHPTDILLPSIFFLPETSIEAKGSPSCKSRAGKSLRSQRVQFGPVTLSVHAVPNLPCWWPKRCPA